MQYPAEGKKTLDPFVIASSRVKGWRDAFEGVNKSEWPEMSILLWPKSLVMPNSTDTRFNQLFDRVRALEEAMERLGGGAPFTIPRESSWLKRFVKKHELLINLTFPILLLAAGVVLDKRIDSKIEPRLSSLDDRVNQRVGGLTTRLEHLETVDARLEGKLDAVLQLFGPQIANRIKAAAALSPNELRKELPQVKALTAIAKEQGVRAPLASIKALGTRVIGLASESAAPDSVWQVTLAVLNYRSFLNASLVSPEVTSVHQEPWNLELGIHHIPGENFGQVSWLGHTHDSAEIPAMYKLEDGPLNPPTNVGPQYLKVVGGSIWLDGAYLKRVILENVAVTYDGGLAVLDPVYFINCTFKVRFNEKGERFSHNVLASLPVSFEAEPKT